MTLNKQALRVPERKRHDWSRGVMRYCDFCDHWAITVKHEDGENICASCCDIEYTSALKDALEMAIERAEAAEKRIAELLKSAEISLEYAAGLENQIESAELRIAELERKEHHRDRQSVIDALATSGEAWSDIEEYMQKWDEARAAGIKIKGE